MAYQAVLFDMDGTVLNTLDDLTDAVNYTLDHFSLPPVARSHVRKNLGHGAQYLIAHCVPEECGPDTVAQVLALYKPWYDRHCRIKTAPYPGMTELMNELSEAGILLAVVSNKPDTAVQELVNAFFPGLLECAVGEKTGVRTKPHPDTLLAAVEKLGVPLEQCVYVGDSEVDVETARNAGMDGIAVVWGFRDEEELLRAGAEVLVHSMNELKERILIHG